MDADLERQHGEEVHRPYPAQGDGTDQLGQLAARRERLLVTQSAMARAV